jgi:hypothetical protein
VASFHVTGRRPPHAAADASPRRYAAFFVLPDAFDDGCVPSDVAAASLLPFTLDAAAFAEAEVFFADDFFTSEDFFAVPAVRLDVFFFDASLRPLPLEAAAFPSSADAFTPAADRVDRVVGFVFFESTPADAFVDGLDADADFFAASAFATQAVPVTVPAIARIATIVRSVVISSSFPCVCPRARLRAGSHPHARMIPGPHDNPWQPTTTPDKP